MTLFLQLLPQLQIVVGLAVVADCDGLILVIDRLPASLKVNDTQPLRTHVEGRAIRRHVAALTVWTSMDNRLPHPVQKAVFVESRKSVNAAHEEDSSAVNAWLDGWYDTTKTIYIASELRRH